MFSDKKHFSHVFVWVWPNLPHCVFTITVCMDGTLPGYHWHRGYGSGANSWLIQLEVCEIRFEMS